MILRYIIKRPIAVTMILLVMVVLGLVSLRILPVSLIPDVDIPLIVVQSSEPSLSAREIDEQIVAPLRSQLIQVSGLQDIECEARDGNAKINLTFNQGSNIDYLFIEVNEKIDRVLGMLPRMDRPKVIKSCATDIPAFFVNITQEDNESFSYLSRFTKDVIVKRIEQLPEIAMVDISGTIDEEILIVPDKSKISQRGLNTEIISRAIRSADISLGALTIRDGQYRFSVKFDSKTENPEDIANVWLNIDGRLLQIKDIAEVSINPGRRTGLVRMEGKQAISMAIIKQNDARMSSLKASLDKLINRLEKDYPQLDFHVTRDQTSLLEYSINSLVWNIVLGILFSCLVIVFFLQDFRSSTLVSLIIPLSLIVAMLLFYVSGISLNIISLSGLLLGVGMMVDNTIILIDNITARWQRGEILEDAIVKGTREVMGPMLSSVLTTCAVFIPLIFINGIAGALFHDEAIAIAIVLFTSYFLTITVIPVYYWCWFKGMTTYEPSFFSERMSFDDVLLIWDERCMDWWIDHRKWAATIIGICFLISCVFFSIMRKERLPEITHTEAIMSIDWNEQISIEENERRTIYIEDLLTNDAFDVTSMVGTQQFVLNHSGDLGMNETRVYFKCEDSRTLSALCKKVAQHLSDSFPTSNWSFAPADNIFDMVFADSQDRLTARIRPTNEKYIKVSSLRPLVDSLRSALPEESIPEINTRTDILLIADVEKMALYDISFDALTAILKESINGLDISSVNGNNHTFPVIIGSGKEDLTTMLSETFIRKNDVMVPISEIVRQSYAEGLKILHSGVEGTYFPVRLQLPYNDAPHTMGIVRSVVSSGNGYDVSFSGSWFTSRRLVLDLIVILLISITILYLILASQFESLIQPLIVLFELVMDMAVSLAVLWVMNISLNVMTLIGLIVVAGIVINDSILKIDTINKMRLAGMPLRKAVSTASQRRMKAIIMTSLTTILAIVPFLSRGSLGADLQYPMCIVIIIGMFVGTFISLFIIPSLYYGFYTRKDRS